MKRSPTRLEIKMVRHWGEVGAGTPVPNGYDNILPFMPKSELHPVAVPVGMSSEDVGLVTVRGLSLTDFGIFDSDELVITKRFHMRDIDENTVCIVYIHATGELVAKRIVENANTLTLKASGGGISDKEYSPDEVEVRAIVLKVQFDIDKQIARAQEARIRSNGIGRRKKDELTPRLWNNEEIPY